MKVHGLLRTSAWRLSKICRKRSAVILQNIHNRKASLWRNQVRQKKRALLIGFAVVSVAGLLLGTALPELFHMGTGTYAGFFSLYSFQKFEHTVVNSWKLFLFLVCGRLQLMLFLWMSVFTPIGVWIHFGYLFWLTASAGMLLSLFVLRDGYEGILLFLCCIFPQWLLYGSAWKREFLFLAGQAGRIRGQGEIQPILQQRRVLFELGRMILFFISGCAAEAYLGQWTLKIFLQIQ